MKKIISKSGFNADYFNELAISIGLVQRKRMLQGEDYFQLILFNAAKMLMSFNTMASTFADCSKKSVSKQRLHNVFKCRSFQSFFDVLFQDITSLKINSNCVPSKLGFKRILIQDSTIIKLHHSLYELFSGVSNGCSKVTNCRIQIAFDILSNLFVYNSIDSYSKNDLKASWDLIIKKGDLIIRDRGYFNTKQLYEIITKKAHFITRYYHSVSYFDEYGNLLNILQVLHKTNRTKMKVRIGSANAPFVYLYAAKISEELGNQRRMQAKKNVGGKRKVGKEVLELLSWSIYITSIEDDDMSIDDLIKIYALRWRIEIIFKALKSHINLDSIHKVPIHQLKIIIKARILLIIITINLIYQPLKTKNNMPISILKLVQYIVDNIRFIGIIIKEAMKQSSENSLIRNIYKYCKYEKRKNRTNYEEELFLSLS